MECQFFVNPNHGDAHLFEAYAHLVALFDQFARSILDERTLNGEAVPVLPSEHVVLRTHVPEIGRAKHVNFEVGREFMNSLNELFQL